MSQSKPKRQRISFACVYCRRRKIGCDKQKPSCSRCIKLGIDCVYNIPQWVKDIGETQEIDGDKETLMVEIGRLKEQLKEQSFRNESIPTTPDDHSQQSISEEFDNDTMIDFYESYNSLSMKNSSHEDHKPLSITSAYKKDVYFSFFFSYMALTLRLNSDLFQEHWKSKHSDGSKWLILLDTKKEDSDLKDSIKNIVSDRSQLSRMNFLPVLKLHSLDDDLKLRKLELKIEKLLPGTKKALDAYWEFYMDYVWPIRSFISRDKLKQDVDELIEFDGVKPRIRLRTMDDLPTLGIFLIILRFTSCAVQLTDFGLFDTLKEFPITIDAITMAKTSISLCHANSRNELRLLQCFMLLRCYFKDCSEDGDGSSSSQSQNSFGYIVSQVLKLGINRDPRDNSDESEMRRLFWYSLLEIDSRCVILSGVLSVVPLDLSNVRPPVIQQKDDHFMKVLKEEIAKLEELQNLYYSISDLVNDIRNKTSLNKLLALLQNASDYININYNLKNMISFKGIPKGSKHYKALALRNLRILTTNLIQISLEIQVHSSIYTFAESNSHLDINLYSLHYSKMLECSRKITDLSTSFFLGYFDEFIDQGYRFEILPLLNMALLRVFTCGVTSLLRLYHLLDLIKSDSYEGDLTNDVVEKFIIAIVEPAELLLSLHKTHLAKKYYSGLKIFACYKYAFATLKSYRFQTMNKIIRFLETEEQDPNLNVYKKDEVRKKLQNETSTLKIYKEWTRLDPDSNDTIVNLNNTNMFIKQSSNFIQNCIQTIQSPYIHCPDFIKILKSSPPDPLSLAHSDLISSIVTGKRNKTANDIDYVALDPLTELEIDDEFFNEVFSINMNVMHSDQDSSDGLSGFFV